MISTIHYKNNLNITLHCCDIAVFFYISIGYFVSIKFVCVNSFLCVTLKAATIVRNKIIKPNKFKFLTALNNKSEGNKSMPYNAVQCGAARQMRIVDVTATV